MEEAKAAHQPQTEWCESTESESERRIIKKSSPTHFAEKCRVINLLVQFPSIS